MFGWIHETLWRMVTCKHGPKAYAQALEVAKFDDETERDAGKNYPDDDTYRLVSAIASVINVSVDDVWEAFGAFVIEYSFENGWHRLLHALSDNFKGFLDGLDSLHYFIDHTVYKVELNGPTFWCEEQADGNLHFHYYSRRSNLYPIVKGVLREAAKQFFRENIIVEVVDIITETLSNSSSIEHVILNVVELEKHTKERFERNLIAETSVTLINKASNYAIQLSDFCQAFPHHFCFNRDLVVEHVGKHLSETFPFIIYGKSKLTDLLILTHPEIPVTFDSILKFQNSMFVFQLKENTDKAKSEETESEQAEAEQAEANLTDTKFPVTLKGSIIGVNNNNYLIFMCSLNLTSLRELVDRNLYISDMQRHDSTRDLIMLNQSRISQVELNRRLEETARDLHRMATELKSEKQKTEALLCELMPASVAESLRRGDTVKASEFQEVTILFTDIVTFTNICARCSPYDVVHLLNDLYLRFDRLAGLHDTYKVETIGDAYVVCGGVPQECANHSEKVLNMSVAMLMESKFVLNPNTGQPIRIRVGLHSGSVVAGVVGIRMPRYCLFGDTVSIANKMESTGVPSKIHVSDPAKTLALKTNPDFKFTSRGVSSIVKAKGVALRTYFLEKNDRKTVWELCGREQIAHCSLDGYTELHNEFDLRNLLNAEELAKNKVANNNVKSVDRTTKIIRSLACTIL